MLEGLIPLFQKLENLCMFVVYSSKSPAQAQIVSQEFEDEFLRFQENLRSQIELSIAASTELQEHYHSEFSQLPVF